jgi:hypothetical protein
MLTGDNLGWILELAKAATPGPYTFVCDDKFPNCGYVRSDSVEGDSRQYESKTGYYGGKVLAESRDLKTLELFAALSPEVITALIPIVQAAYDLARSDSDPEQDACVARVVAAVQAAFEAPRDAPKTPTPGAIIDAEFDEVDP